MEALHKKIDVESPTSTYNLKKYIPTRNIVPPLYGALFLSIKALTSLKSFINTTWVLKKTNKGFFSALAKPVLYVQNPPKE